MNPYIHTDMKTKRLLTLAAVLFAVLPVMAIGRVAAQNVAHTCSKEQ